MSEKVKLASWVGDELAKARIQELEAQVERLRNHICKYAALCDGGESDLMLSETPAQSLEAVKREAWEDGNHGQKAFWEGFERGSVSDNKNIRQHWEEWKSFRLSQLKF